MVYLQLPHKLHFKAKWVA